MRTGFIMRSKTQAVLCAIAFCIIAHGADRYTFKTGHDCDGISKFYQGREIAQVMGHQAADWLERPERQDEERPDLLMEALKLKPGMKVADIGAGTGYFTWRMAGGVAP